MFPMKQEPNGTSAAKVDQAAAQLVCCGWVLTSGQEPDMQLDAMAFVVEADALESSASWFGMSDSGVSLRRLVCIICGRAVELDFGNRYFNDHLFHGLV